MNVDGQYGNTDDHYHSLFPTTDSLSVLCIYNRNADLMVEIVGLIVMQVNT